VWVLLVTIDIDETQRFARWIRRSRVVVLRCARCDKDLDVPALKFDTLDYVKQLTSAGVEAQVAEIHAMTMKQAFGMYIDDVITKDYLDATLDARFAEQDVRWESRFAEQDLRIEQRFADQNLKIEKRISELDSKFEKRFNSTESDLRVLKWGQAVLVAAVLLPQVARLAG
jgi:fructosamine-3-kinase